MAGKWCTERVGDLADSISDTHKFGKDRLIFLNTSDVLLGKILHHSYSAVCEWPGQAKKSIQRGDILFSEIRPANGRWAYVNVDAQDYVVSTKLMVIRPRRNRVAPRFLYHFLTSPEITRWLQHLAESRSGTFPQITFDQVAELELSLPHLKVQEQIAAFFDEIDDKIELNRRMNETLEAMTQVIFKSWFVDFDPARAKAEGRNSSNIDAKTVALFPNRFQDSELGEIPAGWTAGRLGDLIGFLGGYAFKSRDWVEDGVPVVKIGSVKPGIVDLNEVSFVSEEVAEEARRFWLKPGDLLIGMTGYVGEVGLVPPTNAPPLLNQRVGKFVLEKDGTEALAFIYCLTRRSDFKTAVETKSHGTAQANVSAEGILSISVIVPPKPVRDAFNCFCQPLFDRILSNHAESRTLAAIRDALLPKLISSELRVKSSIPC